MNIAPSVDVERLVSAQIVASIYGNSPEFWLRKARNEDIVHTRLGRSVRFKLSQVEAWIAGQ